jgi:hypothetical protein
MKHPSHNTAVFTQQSRCRKVSRLWLSLRSVHTSGPHQPRAARSKRVKPERGLQMGRHQDVRSVFAEQQNGNTRSIAKRAAASPQRHMRSTQSPPNKSIIKFRSNNSDRTQHPTPPTAVCARQSKQIKGNRSAQFCQHIAHKSAGYIRKTPSSTNPRGGPSNCSTTTTLPAFLELTHEISGTWAVTPVATARRQMLQNLNDIILLAPGNLNAPRKQNPRRQEKKREFSELVWTGPPIKTLKIALLDRPAPFYLKRMIPLLFSAVLNVGGAARWKGLLAARRAAVSEAGV